MARGSKRDPTAGSAHSSYCPPWELDEIRHRALGRMMTGLGLSLLGIVLGLISPAVAAQGDYSAPDALQLGAVGLVAMVLVLVLLSLLRRSGRSVTNRQDGGHNASSSQQTAGKENTTFMRLDDARILRKVREQFDRCRNQQDYLGVLRIGLDHDASPDSDYAEAAVRETVASIARSRGTLLLPDENGEFVIVLCGDLPDQAVEIGDDIREAIADLALPGAEEIITASVGLFIARPDGERRSEHYLERASRTLKLARSRGGNRVESETV